MVWQPGVTVIAATNRPNYMERVLANYQRQNHPNKELIIILNNNHFDLGQWQKRINPYKDIRVFEIRGRSSLGYCYNYAVHQARHQLVAKFDDDDYYSSEYLLESTKLVTRTNADIVGKSCRFIYFADLSTLALYCPNPENAFVPYVVGATMIINKRVFRKLGFPDYTYGEDSQFQKECLQAGFTIFSGDRHHYVTIRQPSVQNHTFQIDDREYLRQCQIINEVPSYLAEFIGVQ